MRKYLPTVAELIDRLSIVTLKSIKLNHKESYEKEATLLKHDIDLLLKENKIRDFGKFIRAVQVNMLANELIWANEQKARLGGNNQNHLLKFTHTINGMRRRAGNVICIELGNQIDLNPDTVDEKLCKQFGYDFSKI